MAIGCHFIKGGWVHGIPRGICETKTMQNFQGSVIKKEVERLGVIKRNMSRISMGPSFWSWNLQGV